jgi:hypothetical protein
MNFKSIVKKVDNKEVLTCILLIIVGYMTAQLFMRRMNGFNVGGQNSCYFKDVTCKLGQSEYPIPSGKSDPCKGISEDKCNTSWYENTIKGGANKTTPIGIACLWNSSGKDCVTPGTGFHSSSGCPTKSCSGSGVKPTPPTPPTPPPPPSYSCSSTSIFSADKCLKNGSVVTDPSSDDGCKDCHGILSPHKFWLWLIIVISIIVFLIIIYAIS